MKLEFVDTLVLAHPYIKGFDRTSYCISDVEQTAVSIGEVPPAVAARTEADLVEGQGGTVWTTTFYIGLMIERKPGALEFLSGGWEVRGGWGLADAVRLTSAAGATGPRKLDISYPTNEFTKLVKMWDKYDPDTMGVIVRYIKRCVPPVVVRFALSRKGLLIVSLCVVRRSRSTCEKERNPNRPRREASSAQSPARCDPTSPSSPALPPKGDLLTSLLP